MPSGAYARGTHAQMAAEEEEEDEENKAKPQLQWAGGPADAPAEFAKAGYLGQVDRTTAPKLAASVGGTSGGLPVQKKALIVAADTCKQRGPEASLDMQPAAEQLKALLVDGGLGWKEEDITLLSGEGATKEAVLEALEALSTQVGRRDVAFVALLCHGKKLIDLDEADPESDDPPATEEALCLTESEPLTEEDLKQPLQKFADKSAHVFLWLDSCFEAAPSQPPKRRTRTRRRGRSSPSRRRRPTSAASRRRCRAPRSRRRALAARPTSAAT